MGLTVFFAILQVMELLGLNQHIAILSSTLKVNLNKFKIQFMLITSKPLSLDKYIKL